MKAAQSLNRIFVQLQQYDPTKTTTIRRAYERAVVRRFTIVKQVLREAVDTRDVFGLRPLHLLQRRVGAPVRRAFDFPTDSTKVAEFDKWFRGMVDQNVLDLEEVLAQGGIANLPDTQWQAAFVKQGYTKGASRTLTRMARLYKDIPPSDIIDSILASPFHQGRLKALYTRNFNELKGITDAMSQQISRELTEGLATGIGPEALARRLRDRVDKVGIARGRVLARTEIIRANAEGQLATFEQFGVQEVMVEAEFQTAGDDRVCPQCAALEGKIYTVEDARGVIPVHPRCLPGNSLVSSRGGVSAATKRLYEGEIVIIQTASGHEFTSTPNHPVLTDRGWLPVKSLDQGSRVVRYVGGQEPSVGGEHEEQQVVSRIEDVFRSLRKTGTEFRIGGSPSHFHGDGSEREVHIVRADRGLESSELNAPVCHHFHENRLQVGRRVYFPLLALRNLGSVFQRLFFPTDAFVRRSDLGFSLLGGSATPDAKIGLGSLPVFLGPGPSGGTRFPVGSGESFPLEKVPHLPLGDPEDFCQVRRTLSGEVQFDEVVRVTNGHYSGHVYNLQVADGFYFASSGSIITHNCRCNWLPVVGDRPGIPRRPPPEPGGNFTQGDRDSVIRDIIRDEDRGTRDDGWLLAFRRQVWGNQNAKFVKGGAFDKIKSPVMLRGINRRLDFPDNYQGKWAGKGVWGNGSYYGTGSKGLKQWRGHADPLKNGHVYAAKLDPTAKIAKIDDIALQRNRLTGVARNEFTEDLGRLAARLGYDAVETTDGSIIVLNNAKVIIDSRSLPNSSRTFLAWLRRNERSLAVLPGKQNDLDFVTRHAERLRREYNDAALAGVSPARGKQLYEKWQRADTQRREILREVDQLLRRAAELKAGERYADWVENIYRGKKTKRKRLPPVKREPKTRRTRLDPLEEQKETVRKRLQRTFRGQITRGNNQSSSPMPLSGRKMFDNAAKVMANKGLDTRLARAAGKLRGIRHDTVQHPEWSGWYTHGRYSRTITMGGDTVKGSLKWGTEVIIHEFGHHLDHLLGRLGRSRTRLGPGGSAQFTKMHGEFVRARQEVRSRLGNVDFNGLQATQSFKQNRWRFKKVISGYGLTNREEWFAEAFAFYFLKPAHLRRVAPETYKFMDQFVRGEILPANLPS